MTLPTVQLQPSVEVARAIQVVRMLATNCYNSAQPVGVMVPAEKQHRYAIWAKDTEGQLRTVLASHDVADLFNSPRHRDICSMRPGNQLVAMITAEVDDHAARLNAVADALELGQKLFTGAGACVVPDTSFYIEHKPKLEDIDFRTIHPTMGAPLRLMIPMTVVDELDNLKRSGDRGIRWRAGYAVAVIDRVVDDPPLPGVLQPEDLTPIDRGELPRGAVFLQVVFDPPNHVRLPIPDDEIVERAAALKPFAGAVTLLTYDTGQALRARVSGLKVQKLRNELGPEPISDS